MDAARLASLVGRIRGGEFGPIDGLLIARSGRLVLEEYFRASGASDVHTLQSVTKSVTSLLVGIAAGQGRLQVDDRVLGFFPEYADLRGRDPRKDALSVLDLLTMRSGIEWSEDPYEGSDLARLNTSAGDWVRFVLEHPMREEPGARWQYNSGGVIVLAGVLRRATGVMPDLFARDALFAPLGIAGERWARSPFDGLPHTGGGLSLRGRDMAKIGELVLRHGRRESREVVAEGWLQDSTARSAGPLSLGEHPAYYGRLWWLLPFDGRAGPHPPTPDIVTASGAGGQWIFVVSQYDMVVVTTADPRSGQFTRPVDFLYDEILPAVMD